MPVVGRMLLPFWVLLRLESVLVRLLLSVLVLMLRLYPGIAVLTLAVMLVAERMLLVVTPLPVALEGSMSMVAGLVVVIGWLLGLVNEIEIPSLAAWVAKALLRLARSVAMVVGSTSLVVIPLLPLPSLLLPSLLLLLPLAWLEAVLDVSIPLASRTEFR